MLGICIPYFDYFGNTKRFANLRTVCEQVTLYAGAPHVLTLFADQAPPANTLSYTHGATVWQKERLINLGFEYLVNIGCDKVMYMDADCVFCNPDWYNLIDRTLNNYDVVQCFSHGEYYYEGNIPVIKQPSAMYSWLRDARYTGAWAGGAWGFRVASFTTPYILYEHCLIGGGDTLMLDTLLGREYQFFRSSEHEDHYVEWRANQLAQGSKYTNRNLGYVPQTARFLPCGTLNNRRYASRHSLLRNYSPQDDTFINPGDVIQMPNKTLEMRILRYLQERET